MTLDQLQILVKIVEHGSMAAAAEALYRTQPTLSVAIKRLEEEFGIQLFSREERSLTLTPIGIAMVQKARRVLERAEEFETLGRQLAVGNEPVVKIAFDASIPIRYISGVLKECEKDFPETSLELFAENISGTMELLIEGKADLAIVARFGDDHLFETQPILKFQFFPVAAPTHPLAQYENDVPLEDLNEYVQVILRDSAKKASDETYLVVDQARQWRVNNIQTKKEIIVAGLGWGSLPDFTMREELDSRQLVPLSIENYFRYREAEICVVRHAGQICGPVVQSLWESFQ